MENVLEELYKHIDVHYQEFNTHIVATKQNVLGVRMGELRKIAHALARDEKALRVYAQADKEDVYELVMLEGLALSYKKAPFCTMWQSWEAYFTKVDSWAQIDSPIASLSFTDKGDRDCAWRMACAWCKSQNEFTARAGLVILLVHFMERERLEEIFTISAHVKNSARYVVLANAWLLSVAMAKFPRETITFLRKNVLDARTRNLAIQKSRESLRVSMQDKAELALLRQ